MQNRTAALALSRPPSSALCTWNRREVYQAPACVYKADSLTRDVPVQALPTVAQLHCKHNQSLSRTSQIDPFMPGFHHFQCKILEQSAP